MTRNPNEILSSLVMILAMIACLGSFTGCEEHPKKLKSILLKDSKAKNESPQLDLVNKLKNAGWNEKAAEAVVKLNSQWFQILLKENPRELHRQIGLLSRLGQFPQFSDLLSEKPETAGLLASAEDPQAIARSLTSGNHYTTIANLYMVHAAPKEAAMLAKALDMNRDLISELYERGLIGIERIFIFNRDGEGSREYERWLHETLRSAREMSDVELSSLVLFISAQGREIRRRLVVNRSQFRRRFSSEIWPRLQRVASKQHTYDLFVWDPHIWDLLSIPEGELLLMKWGPMPTDLLFGENHYPVRLRPTVIRILLTDNKMAVAALERFRNDQLYHDLIRRTLPSDCQSKALYALFQAGPNYKYNLSDWSRLSDSALCEELGPPDGLVTYLPLYYCYYVPKKLIQNRPVTALDLVWVGVDVASFLVPPLRGGTVVKSGGKFGLKGLQTRLLNQTRNQVSKRIAQGAEQRIGKRAAEALGRKTAASLRKEIVSDMPEMFGLRFTKMQSQIRDFLTKKMTFDVTRPTRWLFEKSPMGRQTFKRITDLEARLFMRGDAKILIVLPNLTAGPAGRFLLDTGGSLLAGAAAETETGKKGIDAVGRSAETTKEVLYEWKKHVAAWWLMSGTGMSDNSMGWGND
jgi:hypothetical protein